MPGKIVQEGASPLFQGDPLRYLAEVVYPEYELTMVLGPDAKDPVTGTNNQQYETAIWRGWTVAEVPKGIPWDPRMVLLKMSKEHFAAARAAEVPPPIDLGDRGGYGQAASLKRHLDTADANYGPQEDD